MVLLSAFPECTCYLVALLLLRAGHWEAHVHQSGSNICTSVSGWFCSHYENTTCSNQMLSSQINGHWLKECKSTKCMKPIPADTCYIESIWWSNGIFQFASSFRRNEYNENYRITLSYRSGQLFFTRGHFFYYLLTFLFYFLCWNKWIALCTEAGKMMCYC